MQRAIELADRHYGKESTKLADRLAKCAFLFSPVETSPGDRVLMPTPRLAGGNDMRTVENAGALSGIEFF